MSETSEERSKRQYLAHHRSKQWTYKHTIYYAQPTESSSLLDDMVKFKQLLRRKCPDQPFLIRVQLRNQPTLQAFLILYTTGKVDNHRPDGKQDICTRDECQGQSVVARKTGAKRTINWNPITAQP